MNSANDDMAGVDEYEVQTNSSDDSEDTDEEEMVEVCDGNTTLYFHSRDGMCKWSTIRDTVNL